MRYRNSASLVECVTSHTVELSTSLTDSQHKLAFKGFVLVLTMDLLDLVLKGFKSTLVDLYTLSTL